MSKYELLTKHIPTFESNDFGEWFVDKENDGSMEHPIQFPYVIYSDKINDFEADVYKFIDAHPEMELTQYGKIIEDNGIDMGEVKQADVSNLDAVCVCAMIVANIRAERFCDGAILSSCEDGTFKRWLARLKEIDA